MTIRRARRLVLLAAAAGLCPGMGWALEHVTLRNGFALDCVRREVVAETGRVRLYPAGGGGAGENYLEVEAGAIGTVETLPDAVEAVAPPARPEIGKAEEAGIGAMLARAGAAHHLDVDLLAAVVQAESGGHAGAVSRAGARGLMQLMPGTATALGVVDAFRPDENIAGGTAYLDRLMLRYHDDVTLALAAYNAGPGAVDRWHGVPPYRETRAYVTRIINEFNRRKRLALQAAAVSR